MKKLVFASVMALASISLVSAPTLRAQDSDHHHQGSGRVQRLSTWPSHRATPRPRPRLLESFLDDLSAERGQEARSRHADRHLPGSGRSRQDALSAASRLLQVDPNNMKAIFLSVVIKKSQCGKTQRCADLRRCRGACPQGAARSQAGRTSDADWKKQTGATYPIFHSAIALDDAVCQEGLQGRHRRVYAPN